jgi:glycosidase
LILPAPPLRDLIPSFKLKLSIIFIDIYFRGPNFKKQELFGMNIKAKSPWIKEKPIYQFMVKDNFPKDRHVSNFKYIEQRIPEIAKHNIGTIWLCGVLKNGAEIEYSGKNEIRFGVAPFSLMDPYKIEERYGTKRELISLNRAIHENGMKVISDSILNHVSRISPLLRLHPDWFMKYESGWMHYGTDRYGSHRFEDTAQFDFLNQELKKYLLGSADLMNELGFDGLRIDAATALLKRAMKENWYRGRENEVEEAYPVDLLQELIKRVKGLNPDAQFLAETMDPYAHSDVWNCGADLVYDPNFPYIMYETFKGIKSVNDFDSFLRAVSWSKGPHSVFSTVHNIDGHDVRDVYFNQNTIEKIRYLDRTEKMSASVLAATLPGVPLIYNGEIEAVLGYAYNRYAESYIDYDAVDADMAGFYTALSKLWSRPLFRSGEMLTLQSRFDCNSDVRGFARVFEGQKTVVALNLSNRVDASGKGWINFDVASLLSPGINRYRFQNLLDPGMVTIMTTEDLKRIGLPVGIEPKKSQILEVFPCPD